MREFKRPMLALSETYDFESYRQHLPLLGSYKLDGIRAVSRDKGALSRTLKKLPTLYGQRLAALKPYSGFDGEFLIKPRPLPPGQTIYHATFSAVMTHGSEEPLDWWIFDYTNDEWLDKQYIRRLEAVQEILEYEPHPDIHLLEQRRLETPEAIAEMEKEALEAGYEGLIIRRPDAPYHCNRSSFKQGYLMKVVRTLSSEAVIEDITEMMHNSNEAKLDARGFTVRSSHQANLSGSGMLGAFLVRDIHDKFEGIWKCGIGEGLDHAAREDIFRNWPRDKGKIIRYEYKPYGTKDAPRQPKWNGWRDPIDIGEPATT